MNPTQNPINEWMILLNPGCGSMIRIINNKMSDHNQFADLDFHKEAITQTQMPPKLKRARSLSSKISKDPFSLPRLCSRSSAQSRKKAERRVEGERSGGRNAAGEEVDYQAYLEEARFKLRYNQLNSLPLSPLSSKPIQTPLGCIPEYPPSPKKSKKPRWGELQRDKQKFPIKYKILCEQLGYREEAVLQLSGAEQKQLEEDYVRRKGREYLEQSRARIKSSKVAVCKQQPQKNINKALSPQRSDKNYVREIFKEVSQAQRVKDQVKALLQKQRSQEQLKLKKLKECQQLLGSYVYKRVTKHLQATRKHKLSYFEQLSGEGKVDDALINFIKFKIKRVSTAAE